MLADGAQTAEQRIRRIESYLRILREQLEYELGHIDAENLSGDGLGSAAVTPAALAAARAEDGDRMDGLARRMHSVETGLSAGTITSGTCAAGTTTNFTVQYGKTMRAAPIVTATLCQASATFGLYINRITDITETGCTIQVYNAGSADRALSASRCINWIAVCG